MTTSNRFSDSSEATAFMEQLSAMLNDPRLMDWAQATDNNFDADCVEDLKAAQDAMASFDDQMNTAC